MAMWLNDYQILSAGCVLKQMLKGAASAHIIAEVALLVEGDTIEG